MKVINVSKNLFNTDEYCLVTFNTTHSAMQSEDVLNRYGIPYLTVPVPKEISAGCGLAIRYDCAFHAMLTQSLGDAGIIPDSFYNVKKQNGQISYTPI